MLSGSAEEATARRAHRRADLEWLRIIAMSVVFLAHVCMVFSPWQDYHVQSPDGSRLLASFTVLAWPWVLPLFMLLSGSAAWYALERYGPRRYLKERLLRILAPLVVGTLVVAPPQLYLRRATRGEFEGSFLEFLPRFFLEGPYPEGNLSATHLWFLGYLVTYAFVMLPFFAWLREGGRPWLDAVPRGGDSVAKLVFVPLLPILVTQLWLRAPYPQTNAYVADWANHSWMALCFLYGFVMASSPLLRRATTKAWPVAAALAVATSCALVAMVLQASVEAGDGLQRTDGQLVLIPHDYSFRYVVWWTLFSVASWTSIVSMVGLADRYLHRWSPFLEWAAPTIYPFYVFHQLVIVVVAAWVVGIEMGWPSSAVSLGVLALAGTLLLCEAARRWGPFRRLFGFRPTPGY